MDESQNKLGSRADENLMLMKAKFGNWKCKIHVYLYIEYFLNVKLCSADINVRNKHIFVKWTRLDVEYMYIFRRDLSPICMIYSMFNLVLWNLGDLFQDFGPS